MADQAQLISSDKLCSLTGLTDRRHRQIAAEGFFPPPIGGNYQMTPTIVGLFRYYRESYQKTNRSLAEDKQTKIRKEIELLRLKIEEQSKKLIPASDVERVWRAACIAARQIIRSSDVPAQVKEELVSQFQKSDVSIYYRTKADSEGESVLSAD